MDRSSLSRLNAVKHVLYIQLRDFSGRLIRSCRIEISCLCCGQLGLRMTREAEAWCIDGGCLSIATRSTVSQRYHRAPSNRTEPGDSSTTSSHPRLLHWWYALCSSRSSFLVFSAQDLFYYTSHCDLCRVKKHADIIRLLIVHLWRLVIQDCGMSCIRVFFQSFFSHLLC